MFVSQESRIFSTSSLLIFLWIRVRRKKPLVECFAKHLALLDGMQRAVRYEDLKNLGIYSSCAWLFPYHAGREASSTTIWSMFWASSNFLLKSEIHTQHTWWHSAPLCVHMPMLPRESIVCAKKSAFKGKTVCHHIFQDCPIIQNIITVAWLIISRHAEALFLIFSFRDKIGHFVWFCMEPFLLIKRIAISWFCAEFFINRFYIPSQKQSIPFALFFG